MGFFTYIRQMKNTKAKGYGIKSLKFHKGHDGMDGFNCVLYKDGKKYAECYDDARGGEIEIHFLGEHIGYGKPYRDLEIIISDLVDQERMKKDFKKGILVKSEFGYRIMEWNVQLPTLIKKYNNGLEVIQKEYTRLSKNETILNTEYLSSIGVNV